MDSWMQTGSVVGPNRSWEAVEEAGGNIQARKYPIDIISLAVLPAVMITEITGAIMVEGAFVLFNDTMEAVQ